MKGDKQGLVSVGGKLLASTRNEGKWSKFTVAMPSLAERADKASTHSCAVTGEGGIPMKQVPVTMPSRVERAHKASTRSFAGGEDK